MLCQWVGGTGSHGRELTLPALPSKPRGRHVQAPVILLGFLNMFFRNHRAWEVFVSCGFQSVALRYDGHITRCSEHVFLTLFCTDLPLRYDSHITRCSEHLYLTLLCPVTYQNAQTRGDPHQFAPEWSSGCFCQERTWEPGARCWEEWPRRPSPVGESRHLRHIGHLWSSQWQNSPTPEREENQFQSPHIVTTLGPM